MVEHYKRLAHRLALGDCSKIQVSSIVWIPLPLGQLYAYVPIQETTKE